VTEVEQGVCGLPLKTTLAGQVTIVLELAFVTVKPPSTYAILWFTSVVRPVQVPAST
jgi:hypothetical protein